MGGMETFAIVTVMNLAYSLLYFIFLPSYVQYAA